MKATAILISILVATCWYGSTAHADQQAVSTNPMHWIVGTWDCETHYHETPQAQTHVHSAKGVYTAVEDGPDGLILGEYREVASDPRFPAMDYDDTWNISTIDFPGSINKGWVRATYEAHGVGSVLFSVVGDGKVRGRNDTGSILGFSEFGALAGEGADATLTLPTLGGQLTTGWGGGDSASPSNGPQRIRNWRVQFGPTHSSQLVYIDEGCRRRVN